ncbi:MAG TPA: hypothetical protein VLU91_08990 [Nitrososphaerales archaeon]|nr:hypothetical protein [Nitrososphaerales archaeon]
MKGKTSQALIERLVTGTRCEVKGCYELADWLVSCNDKVFHWCPKHTIMKMRDRDIWGDLPRTTMET